MHSRTASASLVLPLLAASLSAQHVFHGNGIPSAYADNTPGIVGGQLVLRFGSPTTPFPLAILSLSDGYGPLALPQPFGNVALNILSPAYFTLGVSLDPNGDATAVISVPANIQSSTPPLFMNTLTLEPPGISLSISKTVRLEWSNPNAWEPVASLSTARQLHSATPLGSGPRDNATEVLIAGGATNSFVVPAPMADCELYSPLTRSTTPLPNLSMPRSCHRAVRLNDGRVLLTGGASTNGVVTATCEIFDPVTRTFSPGPTMNAPRAGHAITLLDDGRVLVSGGVADWQNAAAQFIAALNTAQNTAEVLDAGATGWTPLPTMASKRLGHSQTKLPNGQVLVVAGIHGGYGGVVLGWPGQIPQYTSSCEVFDPTTNTFAATASLTYTVGSPPASHTFQGRAFHGASVLPNGDVLVTGGFLAQAPSSLANDETIPVAFCSVWNATTGWTPTTSLPTVAAFHGQLPFGNGAIVCGGFTAPLANLPVSAFAWVHDGTTVTNLAQIGVDGAAGSPQQRAAHSFTPLYDGTFLVYGGSAWPNTLADGFVFTP